MMDPLLRLDGITIAYQTPAGPIDVLRNLSLELPIGQVTGVVGESGSGKSTLGLGVMRYLPANGFIRSGKIYYKGRDLYQVPLGQMRQLWGAEMALVPQDPQSALNPSMRITSQIEEVLRRHKGLGRREAAEASLAWLARVGLRGLREVAHSYPHQLSGGMQQRVMIALALCVEPELLVLDEPTTNLDATTQASILDLLVELTAEHQSSVIYITHNLGVVANLCEKLYVLYAGEMAEHGPTGNVFSNPLHPYTLGLLESVPQLGENKYNKRKQPIPGRIPTPEERPSGCVYRSRCPIATEICVQDPPSMDPGHGRLVRCHRWQDIANQNVEVVHAGRTMPTLDDTPGKRHPVLNIKHLEVQYPRKSILPFRVPIYDRKQLKAVDDLSFVVQSGETLGLVGESGSGKTSTARAILGLLPPTGGDIELKGIAYPSDVRDRALDVRRMIQMVFQNPDEAFNPYMTVGQALSRPLIRLQGMSAGEAQIKTLSLLESVQLPAHYAARYPKSLSGGERQRVALARAFACSPEALLVDEAISALDVSVQAGILNLLIDLQEETGSGMLFISHDLAAVGYIADRIAVIYAGRLMEIASAADLFQAPYHPYTEALLAAIPGVDPGSASTKIRLEDAPLVMETVGCPFEPRCPRRLGAICREQAPPWQTTSKGAQLYCHIQPDELKRIQINIQGAGST